VRALIARPWRIRQRIQKRRIELKTPASRHLAQALPTTKSGAGTSSRRKQEQPGGVIHSSSDSGKADAFVRLNPWKQHRHMAQSWPVMALQSTSAARDGVHRHGDARAQLWPFRELAGIFFRPGPVEMRSCPVRRSCSSSTAGGNHGQCCRGLRPATDLSHGFVIRSRGRKPSRAIGQPTARTWRGAGSALKQWWRHFVIASPSHGHQHSVQAKCSSAPCRRRPLPACWPSPLRQPSYNADRTVGPWQWGLKLPRSKTTTASVHWPPRMRLVPPGGGSNQEFLTPRNRGSRPT